MRAQQSKTSRNGGREQVDASELKVCRRSFCLLFLGSDLCDHGFQLAQALRKEIVLLFENLDLSVFGGNGLLSFFKFPVQSLNGSQGDAVLIHSGDVCVVGAVQAKGGMKVLRHGADMRGAAFLDFVFPLCNGQR